MSHEGSTAHKMSCPNTGFMLGQRQRLWTSINPVLVEHPVFSRIISTLYEFNYLPITHIPYDHHIGNIIFTVTARLVENWSYENWSYVLGAELVTISN